MDKNLNFYFLDNTCWLGEKTSQHQPPSKDYANPFKISSGLRSPTLASLVNVLYEIMRIDQTSLNQLILNQNNII